MKRLLVIVILLLSFPSVANAAYFETDEDWSNRPGGYSFWPDYTVEIEYYDCTLPANVGSLHFSTIPLGSARYITITPSSVYGTVDGNVIERGKHYVMYLRNTSSGKLCSDSSLCDQYKNLFSPPATDCNFTVTEQSKCFDGEGNIVYARFILTASDGRTRPFTKGDPNSDVECVPTMEVCQDAQGNPKVCSEPFTPSDKPGTATSDPWLPPITVIIGGGGETGGDSGGGTGGGGDGGGGTGGGGDPGGGTGGGGTTPGGGGTGGTGGDGGGTGGTGGDGGGTTPGGGGGGTTPGGGGGGTGGGGTGDGGDNGGGGTFSGDGGWGAVDGLDGMGKGEEDLKGLVDGLLDGLMKNETVQIIKDHKYITIVAPKCYLEFHLWGRRYQISFCEYEQALRKFGDILFGLVSVLGFIYVLRS